MPTKQEIEVLKHIPTHFVELNQLSRKIDVDPSTLSSLVERLRSKGFVEIKKRSRVVWTWTERGKYYISHPLPERRLMDLLREGPLPLKRLKELMGDELEPALGVLKKEGLIKIEKGQAILLDYREELPWEKDLRQLEGEYLEYLRKRGLVERKRESSIYVRKIREAEEEDTIERLTPQILRDKSWKGKKFTSYNVREVPDKFFGSKHPYLEFLDIIRRELISMGFKEMEPHTPIIPHFWDLEVLFVPQDHPSADLGAADTFMVESPEYLPVKEEDLYKRVKEEHERFWGYKWDHNVAKRTVLRSHATVLSALTLRSPEIPGKYFTISRVYRPEQVDAKHLPEFNQLDGIVLDEKLTFSHLLGLLKEFAKVFTGTERVRFKSGYFPFTEPSVEMFVKHPELGWIEVGGAGIFREELLRPFNIEVPVIAWGLGLERFFMIRYGINDIRHLFTEDLSVLRSIPKVWRL